MMTKSTKGVPMIRNLLTFALLATTVAGSAAPSFAMDRGHAELLGALAARGITLYNDADLCESRPELDGFYHGGSRSLVVCAEGSWANLSENDLDTIRHESVHFMQDCANGSIDGNLRRVLKPGQAHAMLVATGQNPDLIAQVYSSKGKGEHVPYEEEAFGIAAALPASAITHALNAICPLP